MNSRTPWSRSRSAIALAALMLLVGCQATGGADPAVRSSTRVHYLEIVCADVDSQIAALEQAFGVSFGPAVPDLGMARTAQSLDGTMIAVRAPMAAHELPIVRTYLAVEDIQKAVRDAEAAGAMIAYPPTRQGETGTWAITILGDIQTGYWQP